MIHQLMFFVGNGFDISVLNKYGKGITTSYDSFYSFFNYKYPNSKDNSLICQMKEAKNKNEKNWSDFEARLADMIKMVDKEDQDKIWQLESDLDEIQRAFSRFLNDVVDSDIIDKLSIITAIVKAQTEQTYTVHSLSSFLEDLSEEQYGKMRFHNNINNHESLKYRIVNFNYTALLDNYIYLDKNLFDPEPYVSSNNNFVFYSNPNHYQCHSGHRNPYVKLLPIEVIHPHGYQDVPKSLLFGTEVTEYVNPRDLRRTFVKSFWAQSTERYGDSFNETSLFIIYGCSMGESDSWWWTRIFKRLTDDTPAELIIYNFGDEEEDVIKDRFITGCCLQQNNEKLIENAKANIFVINFGPKVNRRVTLFDLPDIE